MKWWQRQEARRADGFTLLEILFAVSIMSIAAVVTFMTFSAATTAWRRGTELVDRLHHGDFVMHQLVIALRSAYFPSGSRDSAEYGFRHIDDGDGPSARDEISWVKIGGALVGRGERYVESPHRVRFFVTDDEDGDPAAAVVSWRVAGQPDDFDEEDLEPVLLSRRVQGFNCRAAWTLDSDDEIDWEDEWSYTNRLPTMLELTLYVDPVEPGDDPVEMKRIVGIRTAEQIWQQ